MPRGQPDFGMYSAETHLAGLSDMAELAVRLGSIVVFDRRGKVVDLDDFEGALLKWTVDNTGDAYSRFSSDTAKSGTQSIIMHVGDAASWTTDMTRGFTFLPSKRLGVEIAYAKPSTDALLSIKFACSDGITAFVATLEFNFATLKINYFGSDGEYHEIADITTPETALFIYYPVKFSVDFETGKYVRLLFQGVEYDLSAYSSYPVDDPPDPLVYVKIAWVRVSGDDSNIYLDDFILTMDEP